MTRSTRMFDIIQILRAAPGPVTAAALADELEVTKRTIYRDIVALQAMRIPVEGEAGVGYVMRAGYDLPPLMFTADELEALYVGMAMLHRTGDAGLDRAARRAAEKIATALPDGAAPQATLHVSGWNRIPETGAAPDALRRHIRDEEILQIAYRDLHDRPTRRTVLPLALIYYVDVLVLAAWCELREDFRHFRIDRIESCAPTGERFTGQGRRLRKVWASVSSPP